MYLRTPKRYQAGHKRRHLISMRWLWLWILTPIVLVGGYYVYTYRDFYGPQVRDMLNEAVNQAGGGIATITAPTALPTINPSDHIVRGDNAWTQGAIEQAVTEYGAAIEGAPNDEQVHYRYTYGLLIEGDNKQALAAAEDAVTADPFSSDAWAIRALALERNKEYPLAVASALQALALDSKNANALAFMAQAYLDAGQPASAEEKANLALQADPNNAEAHYVHGLWNEEANFSYQDALDDYQQAHDLAPNLPQITVEMAWTDWNLNNADAGLALLQQVSEANPNNLDALFALGYFEYQTYGAADKATDYLNRCLQVDTQNIQCLNYLATVKAYDGDQQGAADLYQRIIDAGTTSPVDYLHAGRAYANLNNCSSAIPLLRQGYSLEQQQPTPDPDRLAAFQQFMSQCGAPFSAIAPATQAVNGGPLLIPINVTPTASQ